MVSDGHHVTLIERRPFLGGRAYSFTDKHSGLEIDNGQHIFLGCCTNYIDLLTEFGTIELTSQQSSLRTEVRSPGGDHIGIIRAAPLPAPLHLLPSLIRYPHINLMDRVKAIKAFASILREQDIDRSQLREQSFYDWLITHGQSSRAITNLWELITLPILNDRAMDVSASIAFMVLKEGFLANRHGADIGLATTGLSTIMGDAMARKLRNLGVNILLSKSAKGVSISHDRIESVVLSDGSTVTGDCFVSAVPPEPMLKLLPKSIRILPQFMAAASHTWSPIINLHVWYDRPVAEFSFTAFVDSPIQWVFNKSKIHNLPGPSQYLTISISGAWDLWSKSKQQLQDELLPELVRALPRAKDAIVERVIIVKEQKATFRTLPGQQSNRIDQGTSLKNFFIAGDWTATGWPATMEGAVRSGNLVASRLRRLTDRGQ
jgi:squalene-associated FAD-dependent desaturase